MTFVIAHRGASKDHEDNTIPAFKRAQQMGADWAEFDVRPSSDGFFVVHHDAALPDGRQIGETRLVDLPESVPTLKAAIDACGSMGLNVEIKNFPGEAGFDDTGALAANVVDQVHQLAANNEVLITSFDVPTLSATRATATHIATGLLVLDPLHPIAGSPSGFDAAVAGGHVAINPHDHTVSAATVQRCREMGLAINVWTVDDPQRIVELASWGVDGVITNVPDVALEALDRSGREK